ncbi:hypothetical protein V2A60_009797 [Cordyceps javanica]|uniref:Uncharacterized protein n=1 Tax=Cordyceps javanica TaxID=43265 RepID=A0A545V094_9HYPO|nr:hypothetical protein IF1G_06125 [Cordyceps javanica]TQW05659.1 hypothetical protein IF2G_06781 [Cordyceps javanica]
MKSFLAVPLLAAAALAAPQLAARDDAAATKPVKQADTSRADCYKKDPDEAWMLPATATRTEDCAGTIEYCLRGFYSMHGEEFSDADACLRSRGLDPATAVDAMRVVSREDYSKGFQALREANSIYNRYMLFTRLMQTSVSDEADKEGNDIINNLYWSNEGRVSKAREAIADAKRHFGSAFAPEHTAEIEAGIEEAKGKLNAAWNEVKDKDVEQLANMYDWFKSRSEEKYYHNW